MGLAEVGEMSSMSHYPVLSGVSDTDGELGCNGAVATIKRTSRSRAYLGTAAPYCEESMPVISSSLFAREQRQQNLGKLTPGRFTYSPLGTVISVTRLGLSLSTFSLLAQGHRIKLCL